MAQAQAELGKILDGPVGRDAIHVAIIPIQAKQLLIPGQHVNAAGETSDPRVGIVDPFLTDTVKPGQWFYLCLYQQSITSLRHVWTHPAFTSAEQAKRVGQ